MDYSHFNPIDFGGYLAGMFFAGTCIMGGYGVIVGIRSIKGIGVPLGIAGAMGTYLWWSGERLDVLLSYLF